MTFGARDNAARLPTSDPLPYNPPPMDAYEISQVESQRAAAGRLYQEFLRVPSISAGLYVLEAGGEDPQSPHDQDEIYYVIAGGAQIRVAGEDRPVRPGSFVFVGKGVEHRFHTIEQRLELLVVFVPAET
jgi:mannose-6-phosphate isomerase-like protein (cupin superfamily)